MNETGDIAAMLSASFGAVLPWIIGAAAGAAFSSRSNNASQQYQSPQMNYQKTELPPVPQAPDVNKDSPTAKAMDNAADKVKAAALLRQNESQTILTSGLGVASDATLRKKKLLGE